MRVTFVAQATGLGYFPGLAKPIVIEADELPEADARELESLVTKARFFNRPTGAAVLARGADQRQFAITIEEGGRRHEVQVAEPIDDPELQRLVRFLEATAKTARAKARNPDHP